MDVCLFASMNMCDSLFFAYMFGRTKISQALVNQPRNYLLFNKKQGLFHIFHICKVSFFIVKFWFILFFSFRTTTKSP